MNGRGICAECGRDMQVRIDGAVRSHRNPDDERCPGSGQPPTIPTPEDPHVALLGETASEWLRAMAKNHNLTLSEALTYVIHDWFRLPLPTCHPLAEEAS